MCQESVEQFLGRMLTDDNFREQVKTNFERVYFENGFDLTIAELAILKRSCREGFEELAGVIDGRLKRSGSVPCECRKLSA